MIMLVTYRPEFREQLNQILQAKGHETCIPKHRQDVMVMIKDRHPLLIILDMYLSEPSGVDVLGRYATAATTGESLCYPANR